MNSNDESFKTHKVRAPPRYRSKCRLRGWGRKRQPGDDRQRSPITYSLGLLLIMETHSLGIKRSSPGAIKSEAPILNGLIEVEGDGVDNSVKSIDQQPASCLWGFIIRLK
ncbi:hypothetical protein CDAR_277221 [Caerostris darwini]|uniref:Uncharacterized protein n=1 Tax=Caerostris darwini TaxID=1538125 RepID=A0AAV4RKZ2_9ARAC|nr:hypothetical protein CDAR_277221 [Caerostris darwini]